MQELATFLSTAWVVQRGHPPAAIESDLDELKRFFAPTATGRRLRELVANLKPIDAPRPRSLPEEIFLGSGRQGLVTPEGRVVLHLLDAQLKAGETAFDAQTTAWAYRRVADLYRQWGRDRIIEALGLKEAALRRPVVGFNLLLLVNGSIGRERALPIPADAKHEDELSALLGPVIYAFVEALRPERRRSEAFRLRGGWVVTETRRHLFGLVNFDSTAIWVAENRSDDLVARLAHELARDRRGDDVPVADAFDALERAYARARPALASRGIAHERGPETRRIRDHLLFELQQARAAR
jgi:hypothetical protein